MTTVRYERDGAIARVTMNRPQYRNAQSRVLLEELDAAFGEAMADHAVRAVVLFGAGEHWSSGHDIGTPEELADRAARPYPKGAVGTFQRSWDWNVENTMRWRDLPKPTVAAVHGMCIYGGWMIAAAMDLIVAAEDAQFVPGFFQYQSTPWDVGFRRAKDLLWEQGLIDAKEAVELGFVSRVVPREQLDDAAMEKAGRIARLPPLMAQLIKRQINDAQDAMGFRAAISTGHSSYMIASLGGVFFDEENPFGSREAHARRRFGPSSPRRAASRRGRPSADDVSSSPPRRRKLGSSAMSSQHAAQHQQRDDGDDLAAENDPVHIDRRLPPRCVALDHVHAGRLGRQTEAAARARAALRFLGWPAFPSAPAGAAPDRGGRHDGDAPALVGLPEHSLHRQRVAGLLHQLVRIHRRTSLSFVANSSIASVTMPSALTAVLAEHLDESVGPLGDDLVFTFSRGGPIRRRCGHRPARTGRARSPETAKPCGARLERGADDGNRTRILSLGSSCSAIELRPRDSGTVAGRCRASP